MSSTFLQQTSYFVFSLCNLIGFLLRFLISGFVSSPPSSIRKFPRRSRDGGADGGGRVPWRAVDCRGDAGGHVPVLQLVPGQK